MAERKNPSYRKRTDPSLKLHKVLSKSSSAEEVLFKINELLYQAREESTRRNVRVPVSIPVVYRVGEQDFNGLSYTLSQEGVFIKSRAPLPKETSLDLELMLPGQDQGILIAGEVIQSTPPGDAREQSGISGMAVIFRKIRTQDRRRIDRFVRTRARRMFKA